MSEEPKLHSRRSAILNVGMAAAALTGSSSAAAESKTLGPVKDSSKQSIPEKETPQTNFIPTKIDPPARDLPVGPPMERSAEDLQRWALLKEKLEKDYPMTSDGASLSPLIATLRQIHSAFKFESEPEDDDFNYLHVESLLDQASDLLDRGIKERAMWDDLGARAFNNELQVREFFELDQIHLREEQSGIYDVSWKQSQAEHFALYIEGLYSDSLLRVTQNMLNYYFSPEKIIEQSGHSQRSAWVSGLVSYTFDGQDFAGYTNPTFDGKQQTVADHLFESAVGQSYYNLKLTRDDYYQRSVVHEASVTSTNSRKEGWEAKRDWDFANVAFQRERTLVARKLQEIRSAATVSDDGILNLRKRMNSIQRRFSKDFRDALARLFAARRGLKAVYGYDLPMPSAGSIDYFDDCLLWARQATQWMVRFSGIDQHIALPVSIKSIAGANWNRGVQTGEWEVDFDFPFPSMCFPRLRGISVFVVTKRNKDFVWQVAVLHPPKGRTRFDGKHEHWGVQSHTPSSVSARVRDRDAIRDPDVVGSQSLHNCSPVGRWKIKILGSIPSVDTFNCIDDIVLDLHIAFRQFQENSHGGNK